MNSSYSQSKASKTKKKADKVEDFSVQDLENITESMIAG